MMEDTKEQAALDLIRMQAAQFQMAATGMMPDGQPLMMADGVACRPVLPVDPALAQEIMNRAFRCSRRRRWTTTTVGA